MLKLFTYYRSSAAYRVRIALNLKGLDYKSLAINLKKQAQRDPVYLATNPQGLLPSLIDQDKTLTQSIAIIEYLDEVYPTPPLLPQDPMEKAQVRAMSHLIASDIHPINNLRILQYLKKQLGHSQRQIEQWLRHWMETGFGALEAQIKLTDASASYSFGSQVSLADLCLVPQIYNARRFGVKMESFPQLFKIDAYLNTLDAFKNAHPQQQSDAELA